MTKHKDLLKLYKQVTGNTTTHYNIPQQDVPNLMGYQPSNVKKYFWKPRW